MNNNRNLTVDENGHEWMSITQYKYALLEDFQIKVSSTAISYGKDNGKILKKYLKNIFGKPAINYTASCLNFIEQSAKIFPENFESAKKKFISKWKLESNSKNATSMPFSNSKQSSQDSEEQEKESDENISITIEKAKHEQVKRKKAELELSIFEGRTILLEDVKPALETIAIETRQAVFAIIPRIKTILAAETDPYKIGVLLDKEMTIALDRTSMIDNIINGIFEEKKVAEIENDESEG